MESQFSIPKPCHENWNAMTPDEQGRLCSQCNKSVTDFTKMSNNEIIIYLNANRHKQICGRFSNDQLQEKVSVIIPKKVLYSQTKFINVFLLALLVTMGSMLFSCTNTEHGVIGEPVSSDNDTIALPPPPSPKDEESYTVGMISYPEDLITEPPHAEPQKSSEQPDSQIIK